MAKKKEVITEEPATEFVQPTGDLKSLDDIIAKQFDKLADISKEDSSVKHWYDWGNYALNYISSKNLFNGAPAGRVVSVKGLSGTGKSLLLASLTKDPSIDMIVAIEAEGGGFTPELLEFAGGDVKKLRRLSASTFTNYKVKKSTGEIEEVPEDKFPKTKETDEYIYYEGATRLVRKLINQIEFKGIKANIVIILDSLANLQSVREKGGTADMGLKTQNINAFFRTFDNSFERTNICFLYTNKFYKNFANPYDPWIENGGESVIYNPSLSIKLTEISETDDISDTEMKEEKERRKTALGSSLKTVRATIDKSRFGTEYRNIPFIIDFATGGIFRYSGLFTLCKDFGIISRSGSSYSMDSVFDKAFYKKDFIQLVMDGGNEVLLKIQKKLEEAEVRIKQERSRLQSSVDIPMSDEEDDYSTQELLVEMEKDLVK